MIHVLGIEKKIGVDNTYYGFFSNGKEIEFKLTYEGDILPEKIKIRYKMLLSEHCDLPQHKRVYFSKQRALEMKKHGYSNKQIIREVKIGERSLSRYLNLERKRLKKNENLLKQY